MHGSKEIKSLHLTASLCLTRLHLSTFDKGLVEVFTWNIIDLIRTPEVSNFNGTNIRVVMTSCAKDDANLFKNK